MLMRFILLFTPLIILLFIRILLLSHVTASISDAMKAAIPLFCNQTDEGIVADITLALYLIWS